MKNVPIEITALAALIALFALARPAPGETTNANGPRSIGAAADAPVPVPASESESVPASASESVPASGSASGSVPASVPASASEDQVLGKPNGMFSSRPTGAASDAEAPGPLGALDPRRNDVTRMVLALAFVLALALVVRVIMRRASGVLGGGGRPAGVLEILARYPVARGQALLVVKVARRVLIVHHGGNGMTTLSEITDADEVAALLARMESGSRTRDALKFRNTLRSFEREHERLASTGGIEVVDLTRPERRRVAS
ncbi:MAG: flagellar biosynthetic protein FliO [Planctomycetota bacterium]